MKRVPTQRLVLGSGSLAAMVLAYTLISNAGLFRPDIVPTTQEIAVAFTELVVGTRPPPVTEGDEHAAHHLHGSDHVGALLQQGVTLQDSLAITAARVCSVSPRACRSACCSACGWAGAGARTTTCIPST